MKNNKQLTVALVNSILRVLDQAGPNSVCRCWCRPHRHGQQGVAVHQQEPGAALDLDRLGWTGGDLEAGHSSQAPTNTPNP
jgi:hypothetical protein